MANTHNLKRGGNPPDVQERLLRGKQVVADRREAIRTDSSLALEEVHAVLAEVVIKILNRVKRSNQEPSKQVMDSVREFRQTMEAVNVAREARGHVAEAEELFATLDTRLAEAQARMAAGPEPPVAVPA